MEGTSDENQQETETLPTDEPTEALLEGWTREEKFALYTSLRHHSSHMIEEIAADIPSKTIEEVKSAIDHYKNRAIANKATVLPKCVAKQRKVQNTAPQIPLAQWAKLLTDTIPYQDLQTETKDAVRLIANFENFPPPRNTEQIDFRKVYHQIADAMEGKSLSDDKLITEVLNTCLIDSVLHSRAFIKPNALKCIINSLNLQNNGNMNGFCHPMQDAELATLRHLISQRNYNPLNIPEEYLSPSSHVINDGTIIS